MSATQFIDSIAVFQGAQGKFYLVNGKKYHIRFPIDWVHNHLSFRNTGYDNEIIEMSGPEHCENCNTYGSIRGVFVGYCSNCLQNYADSNQPRGYLVWGGLNIEYLNNEDIWNMYPYMYGVKKSEIGDEEDAEVTDEGFDLEKLTEAILVAEEVSTNQEVKIASDLERSNIKNDEYWEGIHCRYFHDIEEEERKFEEETRLCENLNNRDYEDFEVVIQ